jgi:hypothetical protein
MPDTDHSDHSDHSHSETHHRPAPEAAPSGPAAGLEWLPSGVGLSPADPRLNGRGNGPVRTALLQRMQQTQGNHVVQRLMAVQRGNDPAAAPDQQQPGQAAAPPDLSSTGMKEKLEGHGDKGGPAAPTSTPAGGAATPAAAKYSATVTVNASPPTVSSVPGANIAGAHGRDGAMGWTTPYVNIQPARISGNTVSITVDLTFLMELAKEYADGRLAVLQDHENHHVEIAKQKADLHLKQEMEAAISALSDLTAENCQDAMRVALGKFKTEEAKESKAFDDADYPRMVEAYKGVRTPLATLAAGSKAIGAMAAALRAFNGGVKPGGDEDKAVSLGEAVVSARGGISATDLVPLQYNPEFKGLVATANTTAETYITRSVQMGPLPADPDHPDQEMPRGNTIKDETRATMRQVQQTLGAFTWRAS